MAGDCHADVVVTISTALSIAEDWRVVGSSTPGAIRWNQRCRIIFGRIDITPRIEPHVRAAQQRTAAAIDSAIASQSIEPVVAQLWTTLHQPVAVGGWTLLLRPDAVGVSDVSAEGDFIHANVSVTVRPLLSRHASPTTPTIAALPPNTPIAPRPSFDVFADLELPLADLAERATQVARQARADWDVSGVDMRGGADAIWFGVRVSRPFSGTLWIGAQLEYVEATRRIECTHAEVMPETEAVLRTMGVDVARLADALVGVGVPVGDQLDHFTTEYAAGVAQDLALGPALTTRIVPGPIRAADVFNTPEALGLTLAVPGTITVVTP
ncbi:Hypothetical protein I5071_62600 [Sandaracinus amylolyticus]|nr:Hypothetical protein I5071_62600 [Sandaracinus amylolyticus]